MAPRESVGLQVCGPRTTVLRDRQGRKYRRVKAIQIVLMGSDAATPAVARRVVVGPVIFPANPATIARLATIVPNATRNLSVTRIFRDETRSER
jgi:hypothetical protein